MREDGQLAIWACLCRAAQLTVPCTPHLLGGIGSLQDDGSHSALHPCAGPAAGMSTSGIDAEIATVKEQLKADGVAINSDGWVALQRQLAALQEQKATALKGARLYLPLQLPYW